MTTMADSRPASQPTAGLLGGARLQLGEPRFSDGRGAEAALAPAAGACGGFAGVAASAAAGITLACSSTSDAEGTTLTATFSAASPRRGVQAVLPLLLDLDWRSYVIAPGAMYSGNRFLVSPQPYCPYLLTEGVTPDGPIVQADVPRLTADTGYRAEFAANAFALPAVGVYDPARGQGVIVGVQVYGAWGVTGVNLVTLPGEPVRVEICLPVMRKRRYRFCDWVEVTDEPGMTLEPGAPMRCELRIIPVAAESIPAFVSRVAEYGHARRGREARRPSLSFAAAAERIEAKLDAHNWNERNGYYQSQMGEKGWILQTGWVGGGVTLLAMAMSEHPERRRRAVRMLDTICRGAVSPSGYFHGLHDGERWRSFGVKRPGCRAFSLIRRSLECTRDVLKTIELLRSRGDPVEPAWEEAARRNLDAMVDTATRFGHLGYTVDRDRGDVLWGNSACGAFGIEPLVRGAAWFSEPRYLQTARRLADYYVTHFLNKGYTCGGVGDALMAVDSESSYALLAGMVHLHAATHDPQHLEWARQAADLFATWVLCYDAHLPPDSPLGRLGIQPRGAVFANTQNQHGAPGICTASGRELLTLSQATGEERYLRLFEDIAGCLPQMVVRPGQEEVWGDLPPGSISERLMTMDGMAPCGHTARLSTWSEIALLLTLREAPEVDRLAVFQESDESADSAGASSGPTADHRDADPLSRGRGVADGDTEAPAPRRQK
jgi:hypothetical protein